MNTLAPSPTFDRARTETVLQRLHHRVDRTGLHHGAHEQNLRAMARALGSVASNMAWVKSALRDDLATLAIIPICWMPFQFDVACLRIVTERERQEELFRSGKHRFSCADGNESNLVKLPVLVEEIGEVAKAVYGRNAVNLNDELTQVAAVCIAWIESLEDASRIGPGGDFGSDDIRTARRTA